MIGAESPDGSSPLAAATGDALAQDLKRTFERWESARREVEADWLDDLRAFNGQNDGAQPAWQPHQDIYVGLTRTKDLSAYARLVDLLFQSSEPHWGITPTPNPRIAEATDLAALIARKPELREKLQEAIDHIAMETAQYPFANPVERIMAEMAAQQQAQADLIAQAKCELMEEEIADQLLESGYEEHLKACMLEACIIGSGAVKGVTTNVHLREFWGQREDMSWLKAEEPQIKPEIHAVSVFDLFPDPYLSRGETISGIFERHVLNLEQFSQLAENALFNGEKIRELIRRHPAGNHIPLTNEQSRRDIARTQTGAQTESGRYDVLEYWGIVSGAKLLAAGGDPDGIDDPEQAYWANVWLCDNLALLARKSPLESRETPYRFFHYAAGAHAFWGVAPGRMMRDSQKVINAGVRTLLGNMAMASGPQVEVNVQMLQGKAPAGLTPWQIWLRDKGDAAEPALRFYQPDSLAGELTNLIDLFRRFADEESGLPSYTHGQTIEGLTKTASGMSMLMSAASVQLKGVVKNLEDGVVRPLLRSLYEWNMRWSDDETLKGDMLVDARASTALISREIQSQRLLQFAQLTGNPIDLQFVDREKLLRELAQSMDLNPDKLMRDNEVAETPPGTIPGAPPQAPGAPPLLPVPSEPGLSPEPAPTAPPAAPQQPLPTLQ